MPKNITVSISDELIRKMDAMSEVNWSEVCRQAISKYIDERGKTEGELLKGLTDYLKGKLLKPDEKEYIKKREIERFTKKWGEPEIISLRAHPPYVQLRKIQPIKSGDTTIATLKIFNDVILKTTLIPSYTLLEFDAEKWGNKLRHIVDYFKSNGFTVGEHPYTLSFMEMQIYVTDGNREAAMKFYDKGKGTIHGLFAFNKEDIVFILYQKV